jgi:hypothetical protein
MIYKLTLIIVITTLIITKMLTKLLESEGQVDAEVGQPSEPSFGQWIYIKDQKPPLKEAILVTDGNEIVTCEIDGDSAGTWMMSSGFSGYEYDFDFSYEQIIKWMPLPKP